MSEFGILTDSGENYTHKIDRDVVTIGRSRENDIVLSAHTASRKHAEVRKTPHGYILTDLNSHNGTFVNGSRIETRILKNNDLVKIGATALTFLDVKAEAIRLEQENGVPLTESKDQQGEGAQESIAISEEDDDQELLASVISRGIMKDEELLPKIEAEEDETSRISLVDYEKSSKVLYVLYQISRKLNRTTDFDDLLHTIMDLIFQVIDADYGFVAVLGDKPGEIVPKVVKYRTDTDDRSNELRVSRTIINKVINEKASVLTSNAMEDSQFGGAKSIFLQNIRSVMSVPLWRKDDVIGMIQVDSFRLSSKFVKADLDILTTISNQMAMVIEQANLNEKIRHEELARSRLERFHSPEVVDLIVRGGEVDEDTLMAPKEKNVTILFTDIVNFTPLSEKLPPTELGQLLNLYFREMTDIIFDYNGTLDKYIGDAVMAIFGAPIERENDAERAVWAALEMRNTLFQLKKEIEPDRRFDIRLGINSGKVIAGNLGSPRRMEYTVIGDAVNIASRLESIAETNQILIGEETYVACKNKFNIREVGPRSVKGKSVPINVYEVLD